MRNLIIAGIVLLGLSAPAAADSLEEAKADSGLAFNEAVLSGSAAIEASAADARDLAQNAPKPALTAPLPDAPTAKEAASGEPTAEKMAADLKKAIKANHDDPDWLNRVSLIQDGNAAQHFFNAALSPLGMLKYWWDSAMGKYGESQQVFAWVIAGITPVAWYLSPLFVIVPAGMAAWFTLESLFGNLWATVKDILE